MTDKERLIEILNTKIHRKNGVPLEVVIADYLLNNDVLPVVRCIDCVWYIHEAGCPFARSELTDSKGKLPYKDDFCSRGERKE